MKARSAGMVITATAAGCALALLLFVAVGRVAWSELVLGEFLLLAGCGALGARRLAGAGDVQ